MPKAKAKSKHSLSALSKAVQTQRHSTAAPLASSKVCLDSRKAATTTEFTIDDLGLNAKKRAPTKSDAKTVLAVESSINVERRIRNAAVPIGTPVEDEANVVEELSMEGFDVSRLMRRLMPRRPAWSFELSSGRLHHREVTAFKQWLDDVRDLITERGGYPPAFEQNLQVWRQLWRVLERCDVAVAVVDVRHPLLHLPPALIYHATRTLQKPLVIVLNKLDTVEPSDAKQWAACLQSGIPGISGIVGFSKESLRPEDFSPLEVGKSALIEACHRAHAAAQAAGAADKSRPTQAEEPAGEAAGAAADVATGAAAGAATGEASAQLGGDTTTGGRVMLGMVGHPNVGKSSLINSIVGDKVVSVKATPGHTKTLQTLNLDERTCLCDSPGLVFPRLEVPRETQIVGMLIPLAQVREPFSPLRWVMERARAPLHELLNVRLPTLQQVLDMQESGTQVLRLDNAEFDETGPVPWSPMLLCAMYASQRGFVKGGQPDCLQAGMEILQRVLEGRVPYSVLPPSEHVQAAPREDAESDADSDWMIDDAEYESEQEEAQPAGLLEAFGMIAQGPGSNSIASRKKQAKRLQREAAEEQVS